MQILHLTPSYLPHRGGVETHVAEVSRVLIKAGHQVTVLTNASADDKETEQLDGVKVIRNTKGLPVQSGLSYKILVWKWIWSQKNNLLAADVIHVHDVFWWVLPLLPLVSHKVWTTFHGWETVYPVRVSAKAQRWLWSWLSVRTIHVGDWIREFYWDQPDAITYGAAPNVTIRSKKASLQLTKVVFFGRLAPENEVEKYLSLFQKLQKKYPKLSVTWVGDGPLKASCKKIGSVTGMISNPEKYLAEADLVAASSYLALWSAQAAGKICLGFYSHRLKQRYLETYPGVEGMLISPDVDEMVKQIEQLVNDKPKLKHLPQKSQQLAQAATWKKVADLYLRLWGVPT